MPFNTFMISSKNLMKRLLISLCGLALVAAGCFTKPPATLENQTTYTNTEYGFAFDYPAERMEVRDRPQNDQRRWPFSGIDTDFFSSIRDLSPKSNGAPINIANMHATQGKDVVAFVEALDAEPEVNILSQEEVRMGQVPMTKLVVSTPAGMDRHIYFFFSKSSLIIFSIALGESSNLEQVLK